MNATRRILTLIGLTVAVIAGASLPASATYADTAAVSTAVTTATVAAPTQVEAIATCTTTYDPVTLTSTTSVSLKVEWWRSTSRGVIGYVITAHPAAGPSYEFARTGDTDERSSLEKQALLNSKPRFTVTTLTSYGWTAVSAQTPVLSC